MSFFKRIDNRSKPNFLKFSVQNIWTCRTVGIINCHLCRRLCLRISNKEIATELLNRCQFITRNWWLIINWQCSTFVYWLALMTCNGHYYWRSEFRISKIKAKSMSWPIDLIGVSGERELRPRRDRIFGRDSRNVNMVDDVNQNSIIGWLKNGIWKPF